MKYAAVTTRIAIVVHFQKADRKRPSGKIRNRTTGATIPDTVKSQVVSQAAHWAPGQPATATSE